MMITLVHDDSGRSRLVIAQLKNTVLILTIILIGVPLASAFFQYSHGEIKTWAATGDALQHGLFDAFWTAVGWLLFKSPWASTLTEILAHEKSSETTPGGGTKTMDKTTKITVDGPSDPH